MVDLNVGELTCPEVGGGVFIPLQEICPLHRNFAPDIYIASLEHIFGLLNGVMDYASIVYACGDTVFPRLLIVLGAWYSTLFLYLSQQSKMEFTNIYLQVVLLSCAQLINIYIITSDTCVTSFYLSYLYFMLVMMIVFFN